MTVRESSAECYRSESFIGKSASDAALVAELVLVRGPMTRREIASRLHMETSSVAGRVNELMESGILHELDGLRPCPITKRNVNWLAHRDTLPGMQMRLV